MRHVYQIFLRNQRAIRKFFNGTLVNRLTDRIPALVNYYRDMFEKTPVPAYTKCVFNHRRPGQHVCKACNTHPDFSCCFSSYKPPFSSQTFAHLPSFHSCILSHFTFKNPISRAPPIKVSCTELFPNSAGPDQTAPWSSLILAYTACSGNTA